MKRKIGKQVVRTGQERARIRRRVIKTATYGALHFCVAFSVAFLLTGSVPLALGIGLVEPVVQTVAYVIHELAWERQDKRVAA